MCGFHSTNSITYLETQSSGFILNVLKLWIDIAERRYEKIKVLWCFAGIATIRLTTNNSSTSYTSQCWDHSKIVANMYQHEVKKYDSSLMLHKDAHLNGHDEHTRQSETSIWDPSTLRQISQNLITSSKITWKFEKTDDYSLITPGSLVDSHIYTSVITSIFPPCEWQQKS